MHDGCREWGRWIVTTTDYGYQKHCKTCECNDNEKPTYTDTKNFYLCDKHSHSKNNVTEVRKQLPAIHDPVIDEWNSLK